MASDRNPYTPPAATVGDVDVPQARERPVAVVVAIILIGIHILMGAFSYLRFFDMYLTGEMSLIMLGMQVAKWLILLLICFQSWRGRSWARVLLLVMTGFALLSVFMQFWSFADIPAGVKFQLAPGEIAMMLLPSLIYLTASFLVFVPGRAWFDRRPRANRPG